MVSPLVLIERNVDFVVRRRARVALVELTLECTKNTGDLVSTEDRQLICIELRVRTEGDRT